LDLREDIDEIRKYTGLCSQKDILYDDLTVEEHLRMISIIKGVDDRDLSSQIEYTLEKVKFPIFNEITLFKGILFYRSVVWLMIEKNRQKF
jgi:ABC-type multidrug transport system ATPase subunit